MKRFLFLVSAGAFGALAVWYGFRLAQGSSPAAVAALAPRETMIFAHFPDFNRTRNEWHGSDIYKLYHEPAVQEFLRGPIGRAQKANVSQALDELRRLDPKDAFAAVTSLDKFQFVGGFRFSGRREDAEAVINRWKAKALEKSAETKQTAVEYQQHKIETLVRGDRTLVATVYTRDWFFASNDIERLKAIIDRAEGRNTDEKTTLKADEAFEQAVAHMPSTYAMMLYWQPKSFFESMKALREVVGRPLNAQDAVINKLRSVCAAVRFENGKMRDTVFAGMPQPEGGLKLARSALPLATQETFLYFASVLNLSQYVDLTNTTPATDPVSARFSQFASSLAAAGVSIDDWKAAFDLELGLLGDWPPAARLPSVMVTMPVKDVTRARKIVTAITAMNPEIVWRETEKEGVRYYSTETRAVIFPVSPTIALSDKVLVAAMDPIEAEAAVKRGAGSSPGLASSAPYQKTANELPDPKSLFAYVDLPLLYARLDASLRPILQMGAAFMPQDSNSVDVSKLPPVEVVTKHLSPIVSSQSYDRDGYVAESIGPVTFNQMVIGGVALGVVGFAAYENMAKQFGGLLPSSSQLFPGRSPGARPKGRGAGVPSPSSATASPISPAPDPALTPVPTP